MSPAMMTTNFRLVILCLAPLLPGCVREGVHPNAARSSNAFGLQDPNRHPAEEHAVRVHYLEIVTPKVDETCNALARAHGVTFGNPVPELGNARTTNLKDGGRIGVRAPMRETEAPVVRPYILVPNIEVAVKAAEAAGATIAMPPMEIPGQGMFAIYTLGGIDHGLWQR